MCERLHVLRHRGRGHGRGSFHSHSSSEWWFEVAGYLGVDAPGGLGARFEGCDRDKSLSSVPSAPCPGVRTARGEPRESERARVNREPTQSRNSSFAKSTLFVHNFGLVQNLDKAKLPRRGRRDGLGRSGEVREVGDRPLDDRQRAVEVLALVGRHQRGPQQRRRRAGPPGGWRRWCRRRRRRAPSTAAPPASPRRRRPGRPGWSPRCRRAASRARPRAGRGRGSPGAGRRRCRAACAISSGPSERITRSAPSAAPTAAGTAEAVKMNGREAIAQVLDHLATDRR